MTPSPVQIQGNARYTQRPIWDSYTVAQGAALGATTKVMFATNVINQSGVTGDVSNMRDKGKLPAGHNHLVRSIRIEMIGAAADMLAMQQFTWLQLKVAGPVMYENTLSMASGGLGVAGSAANGLADQRATLFFDTYPIEIPAQVGIELDLIIAAAGNAAAAFFLRAYLDGVYTELV